MSLEASKRMPALNAGMEAWAHRSFDARRRLADHPMALAMGATVLLCLLAWWSRPELVPAGREISFAMSASRAPSAPPSARPAPVLAVLESEPADIRWAPTRREAERRPRDFPDVDDRSQPIRVRVVTVRARVTGYTAYDHTRSEPHWADGVVAWHAGGRKRRVSQHPHGIASDWSQFPPGATFIRVPGYLPNSAPDFPSAFRVVDDACGRSRTMRRQGRQPLIDLRFQNLRSITHPRTGWGSRELDIEVIFPQGFRIPASLRPWVVADEEHVYHNGQRIG